MLAKVKVLGKKEAVTIYEFFGGDPEPLPALKGNTKADFENGLAHYFLKDFAEAARCFEKVLQTDPEDKIARNYLLNCQAFLKEGVPEAWSGIEVMDRK